MEEPRNEGLKDLHKTCSQDLLRARFHKQFLKVASFVGLPYNIEPIPSFDLMLGFPEARKKRVSKLTIDEMDDLGIPYGRRDYCAHHYATYERCKRTNWGFGMKRKCSHDLHEYKTCEFEDLVLRTKEYEREQRMNARQKRRIEKGLEEPKEGSDKRAPPV